MTLHLVKLCVGCTSIDDLRHWIAEKRARSLENGHPYEQYHITRMAPKRDQDLLNGGSLYWVIKGRIACRQKLVSISSFKDDDGVSRCRLRLEPIVTPVASRPMKPFQGWRYLDASLAPPDITNDMTEDIPEALRQELSDLGLL